MISVKTLEIASAQLALLRTDPELQINAPYEPLVLEENFHSSLRYKCQATCLDELDDF